MKKSLLSFLGFLLVVNVHGQLTKAWEFTLDGNGNHPFSYDIGRRSILKTFTTTDGDFITISVKKYEATYSNTILYVYRFNASGDIAWDYTYASPYAMNEILYDATIDQNDNIYIAAASTFRDESGFEAQISSNPLLIKLSPAGQQLWSWEGAPPPANYFAEQACLDVTVDKLGNTYSAMLDFDSTDCIVNIQKRDSDGYIQWESVVPHARYMFLQVIDSTLVAIEPGSKSYIYHLDINEGVQQYFDTIPITLFREPQFDAQGNWYSVYNTGKYRMDKHSKYGDTLWTFHYPTNLPSNVSADEAIDMHLNTDGTVLLTGRHYGKFYGDTSQYSNCDILTLKLSTDGDILWEQRYQYNDLRSCQVGKKIIANEQGFAFVGGYQSVRNGSDPYASSDMLILVYSPDGVLIDSVYFNGSANLEDNGVNLAIDHDALYLLGWSQQADSLFDQTVIKYENQYTVLTNQAFQSSVQVFPNPFNSGQLHVSGLDKYTTLILFDSNGRQVLLSESTFPTTSITMPQQICPGYYYLQVLGEKTHTTVPVVILDH